MNFQLINEFSRICPDISCSMSFSEDNQFAYLWLNNDDSQRILIDVSRTLTRLTNCKDSSGFDALKACIYRVA